MTITAEQELRDSETVARSVTACKEFVSGKQPSTLVRWLKFNLVGGIGIAVQFAALWLMKSALHFSYLSSTAVAVEAAVVHNFVWHEQFTWADRIWVDRIESRMNPDCSEPPSRHFLRWFLRFQFGNGAVSLIGNLALMKVMVGLGHMNYFVANAIAIVFCSIANFLVSDEWVFRSEAY
jgi:putative flippase GtrA